MNAATRRQAQILTSALQAQGPTPGLCSKLGALLERGGDLRGALACFRQALEAEPGNADLAFRLGNLLARSGLIEEAAARYGQAVALRPQFAEAWFNLGVVRSMRHELADALACYQRAVRLRPSYAEAQNNLGILLHSSGHPAEAMAAYGAALEANPHYAAARYNRAQLYQQLGALGDAERDYRRVVQSEPGHAEAHNNLGNVLLALNRAEEARRSYRQALDHSPQMAEPRWNMGFVNLLTGRFREGWAGYEHRFAQFRSQPRHTGLGRWRGEALPGKDLLIWAEQGIGDTLLMARWVPLAAERGARVILECHRPLVRLLAQLPGVEQAVAIGDPLPPVNGQVPLMSLPGLFGVDLRALPGPMPYLTAAPDRVAGWRELLAPYPRPWIGLAWAGNTRFENDGLRSIPPELVTPLTDGPGTFFSVRPDSLDLAGVVSLGARLGDFAETAALFACLDLVVSVDTAAAHLAGALGRPVWTLIPFAPDWRWLLDRADSPWYPSMRLFRQTKRGDWTAAVREVRQALGEFVLGDFAGLPASGRRLA